MKAIRPKVNDKFVEILLAKINCEYEPEEVPVIIEAYAKLGNCYMNVEEKVNRDGGKVHYGWKIYQTKVLCEAERHAVWENEEGDLIDITPNDDDDKQILFVSDNNFVYTGQLVDNVRVNITDNPLVEDLILVCESLEKFYACGRRIDDEQIGVPEPAAKMIYIYSKLKNAYLAYIHSGNRPNSKCLCGNTKNYKNCHGLTLRQNIKADLKSLKKSIKVI